MSADPSAPRRLGDAVTVIGAGAIGVSMATVFADHGVAVAIVEPDPDRRERVPAEIARRFLSMVDAGLANGSVEAALTRVETHERLEETRRDPAMILECGPERLDAKQAIFATLLDWSGPETVIATASSAITTSEILTAPADRARCLCAHPVNPPTIIRVIELAPSPDTAPETVARASALFSAAGFAPVPLAREIPGFVFNRLQSAVLREAYRLVGEGVVDVAGIDALVTEGLGPRWALSGPVETVELNTPGGVRAHAARMGPAYRAIGEARGETDAGWSPELVDEVDRQRRAILPLAELPARAAWRERALSRLMAARAPILRSWRDGGDKE